MPGVTKDMRDAAKNVDDGELNKIEAIIHSMTRRERREPQIIDGSRRARIARGSGSSVTAVNQLLKQFEMMKKTMKQMSTGGMPQLPGGMGRMAQMASRAAAQRGDAMPPGFEALASGMRSAAPAAGAGGGARGKKKKGGRVTPPKNR